MNALDRAINTDILTVSKSFLPYLSTDYQKPLAIFIKAVELMYTVKLYSKEDSISSMSRSLDSGWEKEFLTEVKSNLSTDKAYFIDVVLKLTEAKNLLNLANNSSNNNEKSTSYDSNLSTNKLSYDKYQNDNTKNYSPYEDYSSDYNKNNDTSTKPSSANPDKIIDTLSPMLEPGQVQLLKMLSGMMK